MTYGVIFDCDGVLVDSEKYSCTAAVITLNEFGIKTDLAELEQFIGRANHEYLRYYEERDGIMINVAKLNPAIEANYYQLAAKLQPMPGITRLLRELADRNIPMAVASSGGPAKIRFSLERTGLEEYFRVICSAEEVPKGKPEPDLFLLAAARLGVPVESCYVVEDSLYGVMAGKKARMKTIGYASSFAEPQLYQAGADWVVADFAELRVSDGKLSV